MVRLPALLSEAEWVLALLEQDGVLTQPGWFYDFSAGAQLVLSLITEEAPFALGVSRIAERVRAGDSLVRPRACGGAASRSRRPARRMPGRLRCRDRCRAS